MPYDTRPTTHALRHMPYDTGGPPPLSSQVSSPSDVSNFGPVDPEELTDTGAQWDEYVNTEPDPFLDW